MWIDLCFHVLKEQDIFVEDMNEFVRNIANFPMF